MPREIARLLYPAELAQPMTAATKADEQQRAPGPAAGPAASFTQADLTALDTFPHLTDRTAARLARLLHGKPPWTPVGSNIGLTEKLDDASRTTISKAKQKLAHLGILTKSGGTYYTAPPAPQDEAPPGDTPA